MSVFQRRLTSSTFALLRSFGRRLGRLDDLIDAIPSVRQTPDELDQCQRKLDQVEDVLDAKTSDEETPQAGREENEVREDDLLGGVVAVSLAELPTERLRVQELLVLARKAQGRGDESKFDKLGEVLK